jgi:hypothetical protein
VNDLLISVPHSSLPVSQPFIGSVTLAPAAGQSLWLGALKSLLCWPPHRDSVPSTALHDHNVTPTSAACCLSVLQVRVSDSESGSETPSTEPSSLGTGRAAESVTCHVGWHRARGCQWAPAARHSGGGRRTRDSQAALPRRGVGSESTPVVRVRVTRAGGSAARCHRKGP